MDTVGLKVIPELRRFDDLDQKLSVLTLVKVTGSILLLMTSLCDILISLSITYYEHIFNYIFHSISLPLVAQLILFFKVPLVVASFCWPLMGIVALSIRDRMHLTFYLLGLAQMATLVQAAFTFLALQIPLFQVLSELTPR
jgi:hypothetical protein